MLLKDIKAMVERVTGYTVDEVEYTSYTCTFFNYTVGVIALCNTHTGKITYTQTK